MKINVTMMTKTKIMTDYNQTLQATGSNRNEDRDVMKDKMTKKIKTQHWHQSSLNTSFVHEVVGGVRITRTPNRASGPKILVKGIDGWKSEQNAHIHPCDF